MRFPLASDKPIRIPLKLRQAKDYPVDLYYLMDLSNTMNKRKDNLGELGHAIGLFKFIHLFNFRLQFNPPENAI